MKLSVAITTFFLVVFRAVAGDRPLPVPSARIGTARQVSEPEAPAAAPVVPVAEGDCAADEISFEMVTGFVYTAPSDMLDSQPGTLMLTDCIDTCRKNSSCKSINYETGLCVLFSSNADEGAGDLTPSQFPVFTIYVQKNCLKSAAKCSSAWSFERVSDFGLTATEISKSQQDSRSSCMDTCLNDDGCRSAVFTKTSGDCLLYDVDRNVLAGLPSFAPKEGSEYLERNCIVGEPKRLCIYDKVKGKILKTVDSVWQAIDSKEDCEDLCNNAPFRCHSYDFNDTGDNVCRLSHHSAHTLTQIEEPYLAIEEATTYELSACYNVSIECHSGDMKANIITSTLFDGKIYAKGSPETCMEDVNGALKFSITFGYNDLNCGVSRENPGSFTNDVIIQHHDRIVTSSDLGLSITCQYDLANKTVSNKVDLQITGEIAPSLYEESLVDSPNVIMRVADDQGQDTKTAVVGDQLSMVFEILDQDSPYEIFVRNLVAMDGATDTELVLIDERGCPAETSIMSELRKSKDSDKILISNFDAFRFPSSDMVQFRALVTPCMPTCEPVKCDILDYTGQTKSVDSYGRKKRSPKPAPATNLLSLLTHQTNVRHRRNTEPEDVLVVQTLRIVDRYGRRTDAKVKPTENRRLNNVQSIEADSNGAGYTIVESSSPSTRCVDENGLISGAVIFLVIQVILLVLWTVLWKRKRSEQAKGVITPPENSTDSLSYLYESGFTRRLQ